MKLEKMTFRELVDEGERLREQEGKVAEAIPYFEIARGKTAGVEEYTESTGHLGLTHWHLKDFKMSKSVYQELLRYGFENNSAYTIAEAYRNLSRPELADDEEDSLWKAEAAYKHALEADRDDIVWFAHGVFGVTFNLSPTEARDWLKVETKHMFSRKTWLNNRKLFVKLIWLTGLWMDWISPWGKLSIPLLRVGRVLMLILRIPLRAKQMEERIRLLQTMILLAAVSLK